jgi:hypothetical protein
MTDFSLTTNSINLTFNNLMEWLQYVDARDGKGHRVAITPGELKTQPEEFFCEFNAALQGDLKLWISVSPTDIYVEPCQDAEFGDGISLIFPFTALEWWVAYCKAILSCTFRLVIEDYPDWDDAHEFINRTFEAGSYTWQVLQLRDNNTAYCWNLSNGDTPPVPLQPHSREACTEFSLDVIHLLLTNPPKHPPQALVPQIQQQLECDRMEQFKHRHTPHRTVITLELISNQPVDASQSIYHIIDAANRGYYSVGIQSIKTSAIPPQAAIQALTTHTQEDHTPGKEQNYLFKHPCNQGVDVDDAHIKVEYGEPPCIVYVPLAFVMQFSGDDAIEAAFEWWTGESRASIHETCQEQLHQTQLYYTAAGEVWRPQQ